MRISSYLWAFLGHCNKIGLKSSLISTLLHKIYSPSEAKVNTDLSISDTLHLIVRSCKSNSIFFSTIGREKMERERAGDWNFCFLLRTSFPHLEEFLRLFRDHEQFQ